MKNKILNNLLIKKPFIIAEVSGNHGGSLNKMLKIVEEISKTGANAIKLQTFKPDTITLNSYSKEFLINDKSSKWHRLRLYDLYKKSQTPWEWHKKIFKKANRLGLYAFSAPFDFSAVDFLEKLKVPMYKIASFENNHLPLIRYVALKKKPMIVSTGMASFNEISEIVKTATNNGCKNLTLLKCTSTYPASIEESNILTIPEIKKKFRCNVGLSDHTPGIGASVAAIAQGATVIEKHFTINKNDGSVDSFFSLEPNEFKNLVVECNAAFKSLGKIFFGATKGEKKSLRFRRSIYISENVKKEEKLSDKNIKIVRPSNGLSPKFYSKIINKKFKKNIKKNTPLKLIHIK
tara:strand:+ start:610 stop:1653 length:1044 start_codon:yes stop_codon:yes gene_type:complete